MMIRMVGGECFFWYRLTRVVMDKGPQNSCCCCIYRTGELHQSLVNNATVIFNTLQVHHVPMDHPQCQLKHTGCRWNSRSTECSKSHICVTFDRSWLKETVPSTGQCVLAASHVQSSATTDSPLWTHLHTHIGTHIQTYTQTHTYRHSPTHTHRYTHIDIYTNTHI